MRLLILTQYFLPEIGAPQTRLWAMASEMKKLGHEVEIVTGMPNYPKGEVFEGYRWSFLRTEVMNGMTVRRVWVYAALGGGVRRVLNYFSFMLTSIIGLLLS